MIDAGKLRVFVQQAFRFECLRNFRNQIPAHTAKIGECREDPYRRRTKRHDAERFDGVAGGPAHQEVLVTWIAGG